MSKPLAVEVWPISEIHPYEKNAKLHPEAQVEKLAKSILEFGWTQPIVVDEAGVIIAGHGRRLAALKLKMIKVPVVVRRDLTKEQVSALRLADNRVTSTEYDLSLIQTELMELNDTGFDMNILGFDAKELEFMTADLGEISEMDLIDDIGDAVNEQKTQNDKKSKEMDEAESPLGEAFGFKKVTVEQSRAIKSFMCEVEAASGLKGADALVDFISKSEVSA
jgi:hypothetical protein